MLIGSIPLLIDVPRVTWYACGFNADTGWHIKRRTIPDHIIYIVLSGQIEVTLDGETKIWEAGQTAWVNALVAQQARGTHSSGTRFFVSRLHITLPDGRPLLAPQRDYLIPTPRGLLPTLDTCMDLHSLPGAIAAQRLRWQLADAMAQIMSTHDLQQQHNGQLPSVGLSHEQRHATHTWLQDHFSDDPQASDLADICQLELTTFRRHFQRTYGCNPRT